MARRQLANLGIEALEKLFDEKRTNSDVLTTLLGELSHRNRPRSKKLKRRVMDALAFIPSEQPNEVAFFVMTPEQHRRVAEIYRQGGPDWTDEERKYAAKLAEHHEHVAKGIERREGKQASSG
jgi:hypothetical protein